MPRKSESHNIKQLFYHKGPFDGVKRDQVLEQIDAESKKYQLPEIMSKKLYTVVEELLGNVFRHGVVLESLESDYLPFITVLSNNDQLTVKSGNIIEHGRVGFLKNHIDHINGMRRSQLKDYYKEQVKAAVISQRGGAGLGLITIAKIIKTKIDYQFKKLNKDYSFFIASATIAAG